MTSQTAPRSAAFGYGVITLLLLAANLRPALTSLGPLLMAIRANLGLSGTAVGLLTALPLLIFAAFSPFARLGQVFGLEKTLAGCLVLILVGIALRSQGSIAALFGGTVIFSSGIGVVNILMPSLIKRDFPQQVGGMTTAYVMVMSLTAAAASGLAVPLATHLAGGWRSSLAVWAVFAAFALLCWLPRTRKTHVPFTVPLDAAAAQPIWRSLIAWQVTLFMGPQFLTYYILIGWMPLYLATQGWSAAATGWLLTLFQVVAFGAGFIAPALLRRGRDQRALAVLASLVTALCILGLLLAPRLAEFYLIVLGVSFGTTFILALALLGMRTRDHRRAASLSTMALATAYLIAASGPVAFGWLHDLTAGWTLPMAGLVAIALTQAVAGFGAGREGQI